MPVGRPYIGPKAQTHVPDEVAEWVKEEVKRLRSQGRTRVKRADVYRDLIIAGYARQTESAQ